MSDSFCKYLEEIALKCNVCREDGVAGCTIKLGMQEYYKLFGLSDTISIIRHNSHLSVETDIEVTYKTEYPYGTQAGKGPQFAIEEATKDKTVRDYLEPKLPLGVKLLQSHYHYNPDKHDPEIAAIHIHAHKSVGDLDEAKLLVEELVKTINPEDIEKKL